MAKEIHIFDMDDTILETPTFADFVGVKTGEYIDTSIFYPDYFQHVKEAFLDMLSVDVTFMRMYDFVVPISEKTKKAFDGTLISYFTVGKYKRMFENHKGILTLKSFPGFHADPNTLGNIINEPVIKDYRAAENKMILTGRDENLLELITNRFGELNIELPNYGIKTYKAGKLSIEQFKTKTILETIKEFGWEVVHFYEDRKDWLQSAMDTCAIHFPATKFYPHLITNIKEKMKIQ